MSNKKAVTNYRRRVKEYAVEAFGGKCGICGYDKCVAALEFHHLDPSEKDSQLSTGNTRKWEYIVPELRKCVCLCSNCHREVHANVLNIPDSITKFNENYTEWKYLNISKKSNCKSCGIEISANQKYCSNKCSHKAREKTKYPEDIVLLEMVRTQGFTSVANILGVSDNAIRKRLKVRGKI